MKKTKKKPARKKKPVICENCNGMSYYYPDTKIPQLRWTKIPCEACNETGYVSAGRRPKPG